MKDVTLCYLVDEKADLVLLALKKRGFGVGHWNGCGGKLEPDETIEDAVVREAREEIGVRIEKADLEKVAVIDFYFTNPPPGKIWDQKVHVYIVRKWAGKPVESEEMRPEWFSISNLPLEKMWPDDKYWLKPVLSGKKVVAEFTFGDDSSTIVSYTMSFVGDL